MGAKEAGVITTSGMPQLTEKEFELFSSLIYDTVSIHLGPGKCPLVANRLMKRLRVLQMPSFHAYYDYVTSPAGRKDEFQIMVDAITTNKTEFFREEKQWTFLAETLWPAIAAGGPRSIRIWSSACSSGEEPYSIAMHAWQNLPNPEAWVVKILASDISARVLETALAGIYEDDKVECISLPLRRQFFLKGTARYKIKPFIQKLVEFRQINLKDPFSFSRDYFDIIFCRNVIIYFDRPTQTKLMQKYWDCLKPGGHLFLGHSESLNGIFDGFRFVTASIYKK